MAHKTLEEINSMMEDARSKVKVGGKYYHYKHADKFYTLKDIVIIEATDEPGILYSAEYEPLIGFTFMRPIEDFLAEVEVDGKMVKRFTLVE